MMKTSAPINTILGPASYVGVSRLGESLNGGGSGSVYPAIRVAGSLHISGDVRANVSAEGSVVVSGEARIRGNVTSDIVIVGGIVIGDITASETVTLLSGSVVLGNVSVGKAGGVRIDEGAVFTGTVGQT